MTAQHVSLWDDPGAQSSNQQPGVTVETTGQQAAQPSVTTETTTTATGQSPIAAAIEASAWEREDIELAMSAAKLLLMAYFVYRYRQEGGSR